MPSNGHLNLDEGGKMVDHTLYRSIIGSVGAGPMGYPARKGEDLV